MRDNKIVNLRVLAILLVVFGHSIILYSTDWNLYETVNTCQILDYLKKIINIIQMPLFFSISGYLFCYSINKKSGFKYLLISKIKRLIVPFLGVGIFWLFPVRMLVGYKGYRGYALYEIIINKIILGEDNGHLWFCPTLFFIFLVMYPLCKGLKVIKNNLANIGVLLVLVALSYFSYKIPSGLYIANICKYMLWFYYGHFIKQYQDKVDAYIQNKKVIELIIVVSAIAMMTITVIYQEQYLQILSGLVVLFELYQRIPGNIIRGAGTIDKDSFGIYLFHSPLIYITFSIIPDVSPVIVVFINFVIFGGCALIITEIIRRIGLGFILGEKMLTE